MHTVDGSTRVERDDTALGDGACRGNIVRENCARASKSGEGWRSLEGTIARKCRGEL